MLATLIQCSLLKPDIIACRERVLRYVYKPLGQRILTFIKPSYISAATDALQRGLRFLVGNHLRLHLQQLRALPLQPRLLYAAAALGARIEHHICVRRATHGAVAFMGLLSFWDLIRRLLRFSPLRASLSVSDRLSVTLIWLMSLQLPLKPQLQSLLNPPCPSSIPFPTWPQSLQRPQPPSLTPKLSRLRCARQSRIRNHSILQWQLSSHHILSLNYIFFCNVQFHLRVSF